MPPTPTRLLKMNIVPSVILSPKVMPHFQQSQKSRPSCFLEYPGTGTPSPSSIPVFVPLFI